MSYYFPNPIASISLLKDQPLLGGYMVNTGKNALRLLLRSYNLKKGSIVSLPLFVCSAVKEAVIEEGFTPLFVDLYPDSFWTNYDISTKPQIVILVHLYGFLHPKTNAIINYCKANNIYLVHDMAQSFGIDESELSYGSIFYSFSAGKATSAAGGGLIKEIDSIFYKKNVRSASLWTDLKATLFMRSRIYGYKLSLIERFKFRVSVKYANEQTITDMSPMQKQAAAYVMKQIGFINGERKIRYNLLSDALTNHPLLTIPYNDSKGSYFKFIVYLNGDREHFKKYLETNQIPYFCLFNNIPLEEHHENFKRSACDFFELSSESTIPIAEIKRVAGILKNYKKDVA